MEPNRLLLPLSWLYGGLVAARNAAFDAGLLRSRRVGSCVISVGNLTAGGAGKTPMVEYLARRLMARGVRVAVVSRGYGRASKGLVTVSDGSQVFVGADRGGDEPVQMARTLKGLSVVVGERRVDAASVATGELGAEVVLMDDGFQHRYLRRDHDILVIDARRDLRREPLLPAGYRREALSSLRRATMVVLTRAEGTVPPDWFAHLRQWYAGPLASCRVRVLGLYDAGDHREIGRESVSADPAFAFSGIGDHNGFIRSLEEFGVKVSGHRGFADHHRYTAGDLDGIVEAMRSSGATRAVTTEKDAVRLSAEPGVLQSLTRVRPLCYTRVAPEFVAGESNLDAIIESCVAGSKA